MKISSGEKIDMMFKGHFGPVMPRIRSKVAKFDFGWVEDEVTYQINGKMYAGQRVVILAECDDALADRDVQGEKE